MIEVNFSSSELCNYTIFNRKTLPAHPDTKIVYVSALKFLFSAFICMALLTLLLPANHLMWSKTSQLLQGSIWTSEEKKKAVTFTISTGFKNKAIEKFRGYFFICLRSFGEKWLQYKTLKHVQIWSDMHNTNRKNGIFRAINPCLHKYLPFTKGHIELENHIRNSEKFSCKLLS